MKTIYIIEYRNKETGGAWDYLTPVEMSIAEARSEIRHQQEYYFGHLFEFRIRQATVAPASEAIKV